MRLVGLTGGIGSGKSTVGRMLAERGAAVCDVDVLAKQVLAPGEPALKEVRQRFGDDVFNPDGTLNRADLAAVVFPDPAALAALEAITHPHIATKLQNWLTAQQASAGEDTLVVVDHPLLIETQNLRRFDAIVVVTCTDSVRRERLIKHRGMSPTDVEARISAQLDDTARRQYATHIVDNSGDQDALAVAVEQLHRALTS